VFGYSNELANNFVIRPFQNKISLFRGIFDYANPAPRSPAPDTAPSGRANKTRYSATVYCLFLFNPSPYVLHLLRVAATAASVLVWAGSPDLVLLILQTSGNVFTAHF
jgi:hypothetical protein